ncbi:hypothetical protein [Salegentibacter salegens]|uniref:Uncharacterized protein n=1 Tax=Salegentibacter salegens TaxID=143223 RepID=A0A1M7NXF4_9FLAO|nr:hypothetical protein [Salegentibacter salegens]PRX46417.1 hypothetical protein LY58_01642 [Salegentibacter salegens]SHN08832.1 hypothetical protein SAMN05878281_3531 [Salegentibacter salegens]
MDLQTRKKEFVDEFLKIQNEKAIARFEKLLKREKQSSEENIEPMSQEQLDSDIEKSLEDSKNDRVMEAKELKRKMREWN